MSFLRMSKDFCPAVNCLDRYNQTDFLNSKEDLHLSHIVCIINFLVPEVECWLLVCVKATYAILMVHLSIQNFVYKLIQLHCF